MKSYAMTIKVSLYLLGIAFVLDLIAIGCVLYAKKLLKG